MSVLGTSNDSISPPIESNNANNSLLASLHKSRQARAVAQAREFHFSDECSVNIEENKAANIGSKVWDGSVTLCEWLVDNHEHHFADKQSLLELGAGTGLAGIVARTLSKSLSKVVLSDRCEQQALIEKNIGLNVAKDANDDICFLEIDWDKENVQLERFDHVLMCDVVPSDKKLFTALFDTLCGVTSPGSKVYFTQTSTIEDGSHVQVILIHRERKGRKPSSPLQEFLKLIDTQFDIQLIATNRLWIFTRKTGCYLTDRIGKDLKQQAK